MTDYDALRAAAEAATPGPWSWASQSDRDGWVSMVVCREPLGETIAYMALEEDAAHQSMTYIAAASPNVVLGLLDELAAAEADYRAVSDSLDAIMDQFEAAEAKVAAVEAIVDATAVCGSHGVEWRPECRECIGAEAVTMSDRVLTEALRGPQDAATADLTAAAPHSDQPDAHDDGERGGEAGGRA